MRALPLVVLLATGLASPAFAKELIVLLANKDTPAAASAEKLAVDGSVFVEKKLQKALDKVSELLAACPDVEPPRVRNMEPAALTIPADQLCTISLKIAAGTYLAKGDKVGQVQLDAGYKPNTTVRILGGYADDFKKREPFTRPTIFPGPLSIEGKDHAIGEIYISGLVIDMGDGNQYDGKTNSLLKGSSSSTSALIFGYLLTNRLVIADNVLLNASRFASSPLIRARTKQAQVILRNNFVMNNIQAWQADSGGWKNRPALYLLEGNSFILNWPYNPDPTTGSAAAVEMKNKDFTAKVVVKDNLFAFNPGGALNSWAISEKNSPPTEIKNNLFFGNGSLFGETAAGAAAMVVKFGGFKSQEVPWNVISMELLESDYGWSSAGNQAIDPQLGLTMVKPGFANSSGVKAENTVINDVRGMLGMNKQGGKVAISNFAPRMGFDPATLPFPKNAAAQPFGVRAERVEQF